jgi:translation initiation factor 3 subunit G
LTQQSISDSPFLLFSVQVEADKDEVSTMREQLSKTKITCRLCKGDHLTYKCPYRDTLEVIPGAADTPDGDGALTSAATDFSNPAVAASNAAAAASGKYVPIHLRGGTKGSGERMSGPGGGPMNRDEMPTLRVTNLSEDADEEDLRAIFSRHGHVARVYIGRDRDTGECKGYAFVSFVDRDSADTARQKVDGRGYNNLILSVNWSQPRAERPA